MLLDSHAHLNFAVFKDVDEIIQRSLDNETWVINVGSQLSTSRRAIELAQKYPQGIYAAVGLHPIHVSEEEVVGDEEYPKEKYAIKDLDQVIGEVRKLAQEDKVVAIGEAGLDYFHTPPSPPCQGGNVLVPPVMGETYSSPLSGGVGGVKNWQKEYFRKFINLAVELNKPLILHCRGDKNNPMRAYEEMLEVLTTQTPPTPPDRGDEYVSPMTGGVGGVRGVIHCFGANLKIAKKFIDLGFLIGFTGIITFKNAKELQDVAVDIDLENILIETDCPYLAPEPFRGKRNEPIYVKYIAEKIAELKGVSFEEAAEATAENARRVFGI